MDFESYVANYEGYSKVQRLFYIANTFPEAQVECMQICLKLLKDSNNVSDLQKVAGALNVQLPLDSIAKSAAMKQDRLEQELKHYKNNMIKESIRVSVIDLMRWISVN